VAAPGQARRPCVIFFGAGPKLCSLPFLASARSARPFSSACRILMTAASGGQRGVSRRSRKCLRSDPIPFWPHGARMAKGPRLRRFREGPPYVSGGTAWPGRPAPHTQHERLKMYPQHAPLFGLSLRASSGRPPGAPGHRAPVSSLTAIVVSRVGARLRAFSCSFVRPNDFHACVLGVRISLFSACCA